jgi:hypothetical protein
MPQQLRLDLNCSTSQSASQSVSQSAPVFCVRTHDRYAHAIYFSSHQSSVSESVSQSAVSQTQFDTCIQSHYHPILLSQKLISFTTVHALTKGILLTV